MKSSKMKKSNLPYFIFFFINVAIAISCYFYPVSRDEFYYLEKVNTPNLFAEYYNSYLSVNPRIGQFFSNLVSRHLFLEVAFGLLLFDGFIAVLFLNIYRKFPNFKKAQDLRKFLMIAAFFILLVSYFGEMFYYTPFSTNYTLTHIFYLIFVFLFTEYYIYEKEDQLNKINYFFLLLFGVFVGMSNEHIPPVLLLMSFLGGAFYLFVNKKLPNLRFIILPISILIGYLMLFFAPANRLKEHNAGRSTFDIGIDMYLSNFVKLFKFYFYYNIELIIVGIAIIFTTLIFRKKLKIKFISKKEMAVYVVMIVLPLLIVALSPMIGTRLLFFSTVLLIILLYKICIALNSHFKFQFLTILSYVFLMVFFLFSMMITHHANQNFVQITNEIEKEKLKSDDVQLKNHFNYYDDRFGTTFNRKILLDSGIDYIDEVPSKNTSIEQNLIIFYKLNSLKSK